MKFSTCLLFVSVWAFLLSCHTAEAFGQEAEVTEKELTVPELSALINRSLVIVRATGRDGRVQGHGTGFIISEDGLIATARHVIGDRRQVIVELPDGKSASATHASDRCSYSARARMNRRIVSVSRSSANLISAMLARPILRSRLRPRPRPHRRLLRPRGAACSPLHRGGGPGIPRRRRAILRVCPRRSGWRP